MESKLNLDSALKILRSYSCIESKKVDSEEEKQTLIGAIKLVTSLSEYENIGICADNVEQGFASLAKYLNALGYSNNIDLNTINKLENSIYIKYNTQTMSYYLDQYLGNYRGVLISCFAEDNDNITGTYGHFPLDLFD
jgi:hypothetical protein